MPPNPHHPTPRTPTPLEVAGLNSGPATPLDRRRQRVDSGSAPSHPPPPSAKRQKSSAATAPSARRQSPPAAAAATMLGVQKGPVSGRPVAKKLVIKNRRVDGPGQREEVERYFEATWRDIDAAVQAVLAGTRVPMPFDRVCRGVEDLCRNGREKEVFSKLKKACEAHLTKVVLPAIKKEYREEETALLEAVLSEWDTFNRKSKLIITMFSFLDRTYLRRQQENPHINEMMIRQFRRTIYGNSDSEISGGNGVRAYVGAVAVAEMCNLVHWDRVGDNRFKPAPLLKGIAMLRLFGVYENWFEREFMKVSARDLRDFAERRRDRSLEAYIKDCLRLLDAEKARCDEYDFESETKWKLLKEARGIVVSEHADKLLDPTSFSKLIVSDDVSSLHGLYQLLEFADMTERLKEPWTQYIRSAGLEIVQDKSRSEDMITRLLELKQSLDLIIREALEGNDKFEWSLREAFAEFMNDRKNTGWDSGPAKIGEMIAKYMDSLLRGGLKALPRALLTGGRERQGDAEAQAADEDGELDHQLDRAVALFRFVEGKDAFEAFYKRDLARRLLMDRSASHDAERTMLGKLKGECGANFTHNLEQMFKDKALARDEMDAYRQSCDASGYKAPFDLQVMVLSSAAWPSYPDVRVTLPPEIAGPVDKFDAFYRAKHSGRILTWKHGLAHCALKTQFKKGTKELLVSALQAVVLLLFNGDAGANADEPLSYAQISQATGLSDADLTRTLQSLACGKARVLTKHPRGRDVSSTDTFTFNAGFWEARVRIKINQIQMKETKEENKATHEKVVRDRGLETQAAIVRIMKSRKELGHAVLVAEVIDMTRKRGPVDAGQIKKEIENLIDKDFLEREGDSYTYLA